MSSNSQDTPDNQKNIATVVGKHADRVMDGLFSEIEELLSGDLQGQDPPAGHLSATAKTSKTVSPSTPPPQEPIYPQPPVAPTPAPAKNRGLWKKLLVGTSLLLLASGGGLWWLYKQGKLSLPALNTLSFGNGGNADVQFSDYLRRSFSKIQGSSAPASPSTEQIAIPNPPTSTAPTAASPAPAGAINASFLRIVSSTPPVAEFLIEGKTQQLKSGDPIGTSGWTLASVLNTVDNEVIIKRNGEIRSLKVGDKL